MADGILKIYGMCEQFDSRGFQDSLKLWRDAFREWLKFRRSGRTGMLSIFGGGQL
jgi:hypothetical protein